MCGGWPPHGSMGLGSLPICHASSAPSSEQRRACTPASSRVDKPVAGRVNCRDVTAASGGKNMSVRAARGFQAFVFLLFSLIGLSLAGPALAAGEARSIVTTDNSDYFGFDLRAEQNFSLDQCKTACLGDSFLPRLHLQHQGEMVLPQIRLQPAEAVLRRGRRQGRQPDRRARHRRAGRTHLLPVLDGRRSPHLSPEPDRRQGQAVGESGLAVAHRRRRAGDADGRSRARRCRTTPRR